MREAWLNRTPFVVAELEPETGDPEVTDRNCRKLAAGRVIVAVLNWNGSVLLVWSSGEVYFASGYSVGRDDEGCRLLADFLAQKAEGRWTTEPAVLLDALTGWPVDLNTAVYLPR